MKLFTSILKLRALRFIISGGSAAIVNLVLLFTLVEFIKIWYLFAAVISYVLSMVVSFTLQKFFTFSDYSRNTIQRQSIYYGIIQITNVGVNTLLMFVSVDLFGVHYLVSQVVVGGIIAVYSFFVYKHIVFYLHGSNLGYKKIKDTT